jgi:hypothetical protein
MAVLAGAVSGTRAAKDPSDGFAAAPAFGVSATIGVSAASANIALPVDANSNLYPAYLITADIGSWFCFGTSGSDAAVVGAANNYYINGQGNPVLVATPQAQLNKQVPAFIAAISTGAGHVCVTGIF